MKKVILGLMLLASCARISRTGTYVTHFDSEYTSCDDTFIVSDEIITKRSGFHRIRSGNRLPKEYSIKKWYINDPERPVIEYQEGRLLYGDTIYKKIK